MPHTQELLNDSRLSFSQRQVQNFESSALTAAGNKHFARITKGTFSLVTNSHDTTARARIWIHHDSRALRESPLRGQLFICRRHM
jgi:hypothetical protein